MKWIKFALIFLLASSVCSWAQESSEGSGPPPPPQIVPNSNDTSLLWQIGTEALQTSIDSFEKLEPWFSSMMTLTQQSLDSSERALQVSTQLIPIMSGVLQASDSLQQSTTRLDDITTQLMRELSRKNLELWIWRVATTVAVGAAVYFSVK